jgi:3alpha(or 20beta)-hydroxysteroid dehydrogenase
MGRFDGKTAIISGGARGQGATEARMLVEQGAKVLIGDVLEEEGEKLAVDLGDRAQFRHLDVTSEDDWIAAVAQAEQMGPVNALINNAGIMILEPIAGTSVGTFEAHMRVNQLGVFLGMKTVFDAMRRAGGGSIVNISSVAGLRGRANGIAYSSTKWAVRGMSLCAAAEFAPHGIRVNTVCPGALKTKLTESTPDEVFDAYESQLPLGKLITTEDVASTVLYLLSDETSGITGAELKIDAGSML